MSLASIATTPQPLSYGTFPGSLASDGVLSDGTSTHEGSDTASDDGALCNCLEPICKVCRSVFTAVRSTFANEERRPSAPKKKRSDIKLDVRFFDTVSHLGGNESIGSEVKSDDDSDAQSGFRDSHKPQLKVADKDGQPTKPDEETGKEDDSDSLQSFKTAPEGNDDRRPLLP